MIMCTVCVHRRLKSLVASKIGRSANRLWITCRLQSAFHAFACRKQAILLDSDSDGIDSDDEGPQLGTDIAAESDDESYSQSVSESVVMAAGKQALITEAGQQQASYERGDTQSSARFHFGSGRRTEELVDSRKPKAGKAQEAAAAAVVTPGRMLHKGRSSHAAKAGGLSLIAPPPPTSKGLCTTVVVTAAQMKIMLGGPVLSDSEDEGGTEKFADAPAVRPCSVHTIVAAATLESDNTVQ